MLFMEESVERRVWLEPFCAMVRLPFKRRSITGPQVAELSEDIVFFEGAQDALVTSYNLSTICNFFTPTTPLMPLCVPYTRPINLVPTGRSTVEWWEARLPNDIARQMANCSSTGVPPVTHDRGSITHRYVPMERTLDECRELISKGRMNPCTRLNETGWNRARTHTHKAHRGGGKLKDPFLHMQYKHKLKNHPAWLWGEEGE